MSDISGSLNRVIETAHQEVQNFAETVGSGDKPVSQAKTQKFIQTMQQKIAYIQKAAKGDIAAAKFSDVNTKMLDNLAKAIVSLGTDAALARQIAKPEQHANLGNVLLGLGEAVEKMRRKNKEAKILKKGYKIERFEVVEFLNSTEKEFRRFIAVIRNQEADEDLLLEFMREIIRRTKILMMLKRMPSKSLKKLKISTADYNRILKIVNEMTREEEFRKKVYDTGVKGKTGNSHLRFWKALKKFRSIIDELK